MIETYCYTHYYSYLLLSWLESKESVWVECEEEMVRCLVSDGWGERVGGGDDDKRKKKKKKRVCCFVFP